MDSQIVNIKRLENGDIMLKTRQVVTPNKYNPVIELTDDYVKFIANDKYVIYMDTEDYFNWTLWAKYMWFDHSKIEAGTLTVDTGYTHKSVASLVMQTQKGQRVYYRDGNKFNLRKSNLFVR